MTAATITLTDFLLARIADDEAVARHRDVVTFGAERRAIAGTSGDPFDPDRVLAECAAKRTIVVGHRGLHVCPNLTDDGYTDYSADEGDDGYRPCPTVLAVLGIYADHDDFDPRWAL